MTYKIGKLIAARRKELKLTQEMLCEGICDVSTLSKIEHGQHFPTKNRLDALLQRLDMDSECYSAYVSQEDFEIQRMQYDITQQYSIKEFDKAERTLEELKKRVKADDMVLQQFILFREACLGRQKVGRFAEFSLEQNVEKMEEALRYTQPHIDLENIGKSVLGIEELTILNGIAEITCETSSWKMGMFLFEQIYRYADRHYLLMRDAAIVLPIITKGYSTALILKNRFVEAYEVAEEGCQCAVNYNRTNFIGILLYNKGYSMMALNRKEEGGKY